MDRRTQKLSQCLSDVLKKNVVAVPKRKELNKSRWQIERFAESGLVPDMHDETSLTRYVIRASSEGKLSTGDMLYMVEVLKGYVGENSLAEVEQARRNWKNGIAPEPLKPLLPEIRPNPEDFQDYRRFE